MHCISGTSLCAVNSPIPKMVIMLILFLQRMCLNVRTNLYRFTHLSISEWIKLQMACWWWPTRCQQCRFVSGASCERQNDSTLYSTQSVSNKSSDHILNVSTQYTLRVHRYAAVSRKFNADAYGKYGFSDKRKWTLETNIWGTEWRIFFYGGLKCFHRR